MTYSIIVNERVTNRYEVEADSPEEALDAWRHGGCEEPVEEIYHEYDEAKVEEQA
jgi:hypothetical protein